MKAPARKSGGAATGLFATVDARAAHRVHGDRWPRRSRSEPWLTVVALQDAGSATSGALPDLCLVSRVVG